MLCRFNDGFLTVSELQDESKLVLVFECTRVTVFEEQSVGFITKKSKSEIKEIIRFVDGIRFINVSTPTNRYINSILKPYYMKYKNF